MSRVLAVACALAACGDNRAATSPPVAHGDAGVDAARDAATLPSADGGSAACHPRAGTNLGLDEVADVGDTVTAITGDGAGARYAATKSGLVYRLAQPPVVVLDASDRLVSLGDEQGLVGLAFDGPTTMYLAYTTPSQLVVEREPGDTTILAIALPTAIHHGGALAVGPDHRLYLGVGDGGADPTTAHAPASLLGKLLAIDLAAPPTAPPTTIALGLRNPWRFAFDRATGAIWIGDVGENTLEEVDRIDTPGLGAPPDFGWPMYEGDACHTPPCDPTGFTAPLATHAHSDGWFAIIGGVVYRGTCFPGLVGSYIYAAFDRTIARRAPDGTTTIDRRLGRQPATAFGTDDDGELLLGTFSGSIWHVIVH